MKKSTVYTICSLVLLTTLGFVGCGKKSKGGSSPTTATNTTYVIQDGQCLRRSDGVAVSFSLCNGVAYYLLGGICYLRNSDNVNVVGTQTSTSNCLSIGTSGAGGLYALIDGICYYRATSQPIPGYYGSQYGNTYNPWNNGFNQWGQPQQPTNTANLPCSTSNTPYEIRGGVCIRRSDNTPTTYTLCPQLGNGSNGANTCNNQNMWEIDTHLGGWLNTHVRVNCFAGSCNGRTLLRCDSSGYQCKQVTCQD